MIGGAGHARRVSRRRAGRALFRHLDEAARSAPRGRRVRAQPRPTTRSAGASCCPTRRWTTWRANDPDQRRRDPRALRLLGRHRRPSTAACARVSAGHGFCGIGRKRLLQHPAGARPRARRRAALRDRDRQPPRPIARDYDLVVASDGVNSQVRSEYRRRLQARHRHRASASSSGSARTRSSTTPSPSSSRRPSTAGSGRTPTSSTPTPRPSSSNAARRPGDASASTR